MYQHYLGVDLHRRRSYVVLMVAGGKVIDNRRLPNDAMPDYVAQLPESTFAVLAPPLARAMDSFLLFLIDASSDFTTTLACFYKGKLLQSL